MKEQPKSRHRTLYRVIYGDTDTMGFAYYANYLRWFEIGRTEMFRSLGLSYHSIEERGIFLPVAEARCKYRSPVRYDDLLVIETALQKGVKAGLTFVYRILQEKDASCAAEGCTRHPFMDKAGKVVRPPDFVRKVLKDSLFV